MVLATNYDLFTKRPVALGTEAPQWLVICANGTISIAPFYKPVLMSHMVRGLPTGEPLGGAGGYVLAVGADMDVAMVP